MSLFKKIFKEDIRGVYPNTLTGFKALKTFDAWDVIIITYLTTIGIEILTGQVISWKIMNSWLALLLSLFIAPLLLNLTFSVPLNNCFKYLRKYKSFFVYYFVTIFLMLVIVFLTTFLSADALIFAGMGCFALTIILMLVFLFYVIFKIVFAPAYILIGTDTGGVEAIRKSIQFTKENRNAANFYVKWLILMLIVYGFSKLLPVIFNDWGLQIAIFSYQFFEVILGVAMSSSITVFVGAYEDWQRKRRAEISSQTLTQ